MRAPLGDLVREWGRIGCLGFGGPPTHIAMLREVCVERRRWLTAEEFEDGIAVCNLLPGPASTQLHILCAWRLRGAAGALCAGLAFVLPGLAAMLALAALFLRGDAPLPVRAAGAGAAAAVAAVALHAAWQLIPGSRARAASGARRRWLGYAAVGALAAAFAGALVVLVLLAAGAAEVAARRPRLGVQAWALLAAAPATGGTAALAWVALKVGALSYGGGFVIVPLMQSDAVDRYGWLSGDEFGTAVALGQVTPGPVVHTIAAVGYAAGGVGGALLAAAVAFAPSFAFVLAGARYFERLRANARVRSFLDGAGPAAIGAILGSAVPLATALSEPWQGAVLAGAALLLLGARRGVPATLLLAALAGLAVGLAGGPVPG
jgi:chromate transporter